MIMEDEAQSWQLLLAMIPMARTPMSKKAGKVIQRAIKQISKSVEKTFTPWVEKERIERIRERLKRPPVGIVYNEDGSVADLSDPHWIYK